MRKIKQEQKKSAFSIDMLNGCKILSMSPSDAVLSHYDKIVGAVYWGVNGTHTYAEGLIMPSNTAMSLGWQVISGRASMHGKGAAEALRNKGCDVVFFDFGYSAGRHLDLINVFGKSSVVGISYGSIPGNTSSYVCEETGILMVNICRNTAIFELAEELDKSHNWSIPYLHGMGPDSHLAQFMNIIKKVPALGDREAFPRYVDIGQTGAVDCKIFTSQYSKLGLTTTKDSSTWREGRIECGCGCETFKLDGVFIVCAGCNKPYDAFLSIYNRKATE